MSIANNTQSVTSLKIDGVELSDTLENLRARQDSITSALSSAATNYNTEIIDARADAFGNSKSNVGNNIRDNQTYLYNLLIEKTSALQSQYDDLAAAVISLSNLINKLLPKGE